MEAGTELQQRVRSRDRAFRLLNRLTAGVAFGSVAAVGTLSVVSAATLPGTSPFSQAITALTSNSSSTSSISSGLTTSSGVSSSTNSVVAVSGGSHP
ncbi:MAG: hypothetical protein ACHQ0J_07600 [Candidatus Dormibacterales bacterium]